MHLTELSRHIIRGVGACKSQPLSKFQRREKRSMNDLTRIRLHTYL